jgi:hypothetical protein
MRYMTQMFGSTGLTVFQCFTPDKLQQLVASDAAKELKKGLNDLFEMRDAAQLSAAGRSLTFVKEFASRVDFESIEQVCEALCSHMRIIHRTSPGASIPV